ncbi:PH domain-containing protein [Pedobacter sp.]|uniref:PH domain-containing protein n=1 Tax=Pedobacter sp. TaxID=1411316 RepID=UPI003D7FC6A7
MLIDQFLTDEQDPKTVDKVVGKLTDLLSSNEELLYIAVQKRPAVNLMPDCIALSNKRIFYCEPTNFGITMNFKDISWKSIKEVSFKEELFGSKFICVPQQGENIVTEYIPKVQARKLYQAVQEQLDAYKKELNKEQEELKKSTGLPQFTPIDIIEEVDETDIQAPVVAPASEVVEEPEDETTLKLRKLKTLFDKQLINQEEYEAKKASILDSI